jgi:hypothetical protein
MTLPTKKEFLATLEPVEHSDCSICKNPMTSPVRLPCQGKHEFCKACITEWFNQSNSNECPMCRQPLFSKDVADVADVTFPVRASPELRIARVGNAFRSSGMGHHIFPGHPDNAASTGITTLHVDNHDIKWSHENMRVLVPHAQRLLADTFAVQVPGAIRIELPLLGSCLTIMSNVLVRIASEERSLRRRWSEADWATWKEMMIVIWRVLTPSAGLYLDREAMYHALVTAIFDDVLGDRGRFDQRAVFFRESEFMWDLTFLLHFVTCRAGRFRELPVPGWVEVHVLPRTGSRLALQCGDGWTAVTFGEE